MEAVVPQNKLNRQSTITGVRMTAGGGGGEVGRYRQTLRRPSPRRLAPLYSPSPQPCADLIHALAARRGRGSPVQSVLVIPLDRSLLSLYDNS
ncbi:hypothetical protein J6590_034987 [Homalodisca vitripennis]|nr:hypothetical protein J6590_034987 [Homalodisca vitripennis]